ncbi:Retrovirus-related Pol polyprotein from type-1 retrotransposable element R1 2 [Eumeta japonica]|uniref:Retrovirus-related Pol polyprotein from type-1 retrotransposable element R1 2 n=1 Tax=Eumeta variegata TaxID=151549 RepID=A0A4C2A3Z9_EUMVA|nr:Retrovirus-related Pol polyprotein from type-1 retrotransposable element R1 2 [Eumeta japonica]
MGAQIPGPKDDIKKGTFVAIVTYVAAVWFHRAGFHVVQSSLLRAQRSTLVLMTKAYRSASTSALAVLAGVLPADLEVVKCGKVGSQRTVSTGRELSALKERCLSEAYSTWQERWSNDTKGRE